MFSLGIAVKARAYPLSAPCRSEEMVAAEARADVTFSPVVAKLISNGLHHKCRLGRFAGSSRAAKARERMSLANQYVQPRLACLVGVGPITETVRSPVAGIPPVEATRLIRPTDEAIFGMVSESPGCNATEPCGFG